MKQEDVAYNYTLTDEKLTNTSSQRISTQWAHIYFIFQMSEAFEVTIEMCCIDNFDGINSSGKFNCAVFVRQIQLTHLYPSIHR